MSQQFFPVLRVSRDDFTTLGFDASGVSDAEMEQIAWKLADNEALMEAFWLSVEEAALHRLNLPKLNELRASDVSDKESF